MVDAARRAGAGLMRRFARRHALVVELKGPADFVSEADRASEREIAHHLLAAFPRYGFVSEESPPVLGEADARFIVDPLDGTTNFLHGLPHFAVSIGLEREGRLAAGVVFDPAKDELFAAERGRGAWLGRRRLKVARDRDLTSTLVATGIPAANAPESHAVTLALLEAAMRDAAGIRRFSSAALDLAYVAAGRFGAFFELGLKPWDLAAGALLVEEAGGRVTAPDGARDFLSAGGVVATGGPLHPRMLALVKAALSAKGRARAGGQETRRLAQASRASRRSQTRRKASA